jgi:hypothetical protein
MSNYEVFNRNVKIYKKYEIEASERIKNKYNIDIKCWCDNSNYDFKTTNDIKYEVKCEPMALKTGNFFVEFWAYGVASGISITKSNYYIITDTNKYYLIDTNKLKELCQNANVKFTKDNLTRGYLLKKESIIQNSIII